MINLEECQSKNSKVFKNFQYIDVLFLLYKWNPIQHYSTLFQILTPMSGVVQVQPDSEGNRSHMSLSCLIEKGLIKHLRT